MELRISETRGSLNVVQESGTKSDGTVKALYIAAGVSLNNRNYSPAVLKEAVSQFVNAPIYLDHPTQNDLWENGGVRSVRDLVGITTGAEYGTFTLRDGSTVEGIGGPIKIAQEQAWISSYVEQGIFGGDLSIVANAVGHEDDNGIYEIDKFLNLLSVDFVSSAGAKGQILKAKESAGVASTEMAGATVKYHDSVSGVALMENADGNLNRVQISVPKLKESVMGLNGDLTDDLKSQLIHDAILQQIFPDKTNKAGDPIYVYVDAVDSTYAYISGNFDNLSYAVKYELSADNVATISPQSEWVTATVRSQWVLNDPDVAGEESVDAKEGADTKKKKGETRVDESTGEEYTEEVLSEATMLALHKAAADRAAKHGIAFKPGNGHLTPPKGKSKFADPVNSKYPLDTPARIKNAVSRFNDTTNKAKGGYSDDEWAKIGTTIAKAAGKGHSFKDGKIETPNNEDESASPKEKVAATVPDAGGNDITQSDATVSPIESAGEETPETQVTEVETTEVPETQVTEVEATEVKEEVPETQVTETVVPGSGDLVGLEDDPDEDPSSLEDIGEDTDNIMKNQVIMNAKLDKILQMLSDMCDDDTMEGKKVTEPIVTEEAPAEKVEEVEETPIVSEADITVAVDESLVNLMLPDAAITRIREESLKLAVKGVTLESVKSQIGVLILKEQTYIESVASAQIFGLGLRRPAISHMTQESGPPVLEKYGMIKPKKKE